MRQILLFLSCLLSQVAYSQTISKITAAYQKHDSLLMQEKIYAQTDRTLYKPGDNIWFNAFITNAQNCPSLRSEQVYAELCDPKGIVVQKLVLPNQSGCARGHFQLNVNDMGGIYKLRVYSYWMQNFSKEDYFEKSLTVQKSSIPQLMMKMDFEREAYSAGEKVIATFEARTKDNKPLAGKNLTYTVQLAGVFLCKETAVTDENGEALLVYELPKDLNTNDNLINVQLDNDGMTESIARAAPIVLNNLDIQILPEGGNIIAGFTNRVAVKVLNEFGKPADIKGQIVDQEGNIVCSFETYHQGMGAFEFKPHKDETYQLQVLSPSNIRKTWNLPPTDETKMAFYLRKNKGHLLEFDICTPAKQEINIVAEQQGKLVYTKNIIANEGVNLFQFSTKDLPIGIVKITVLDAQLRPHTERLVFINKDKKLQVEIKSDKTSYAPREEVKMDITVTDEDGKGVQGNFSMAVVDDKQHIFADDKQDDILSYLLMSTELKGEVYEPNFYFDPKEEKAATALDYVMLTHGWRRWDWNQILADSQRVEIKYPISNKEISGFLKIADSLIQNQTIYLAEKQPCYSSKEAKASLKTDENGFFQFKNIRVQFPAYLCVKYRGEEMAIVIEGYSKDGIQNNVMEVYLHENDILVKGYYKSKDGKLYDKNQMRIDIIEGDIVDQKGTFITNTKNFFIDDKGYIHDKKSNSIVRIDEEGYAFSDLGLLSKKMINGPDGGCMILDGSIRIKPRTSTGLSEIRSAVLDANFPAQPTDMTDEDYVEHLRELAEEGRLSLPANKDVSKNNSERLDYGGLTSEEIANLSESEMRALVEENLRKKLEKDGTTSYGGSEVDDLIRDQYEAKLRKIYALELAAANEYTVNSNNNNKIASVAIKEAKRKAKEVESRKQWNAGGETLDANFPIQPTDMTDEQYVENLRELAEQGKLSLPRNGNDLYENRNADKELSFLSKSEMRDIVEENLKMKIESGSNQTSYTYQWTVVNEQKTTQEVEKKRIIAQKQRIDSGEEMLNDGTYTVVMTDANGCTKTKYVENKSLSNLHLEQIAPQSQNISIIKKFYEPNYKDYQNPAQRSDFRKTIYWNPNIQTNERGQASVTYYNSDEITTFRAILEGNTATGELAHQEYTYNAALPFSITTKIPTVLSFGDTLKIPVVLKNNTPAALSGTLAILAPNQLELLDTPALNITIPSDTHIVVYLNYKVGFEQGTGIFQIGFEASGLRDAVKENITITPKGFPVTWAMAGQELEKTDTFILKGVYDGSMESELNIYPDILEGLMDGVESILNSPSGCFEQVSSSNYPNILALQLMEQNQYAKVDVRKQALDYLESGYKKLTAYEIAGGGFEWYGRAPAHEGLTAYGLVQFEDMKQVYKGVDDNMIERTKTYLLNRRDGKGGFEQNVGKYGFAGNRTALFNAYITWALSEVNTQGIEKEIAAMTAEAIQSEDLYRMSLAALTHFNTKNTITAEGLSASIQAIIKKVGVANVKAESSVTYSYGDALNIETLSFAALVMMQSSQKDEALLLDIVKHLLSKRQYGRFGSTQSTVMALKALCAYQQFAQTIKEDGKVLVSINGKLAVEQEYKKGDKGKITLKNLHQHFTEGQNIINIKFQGVQKALPYSFDANWTASTPKSHRACPLQLDTRLQNTNTKVGETVRLEVKLQNLYNTNLPSTMAVIGIPAGLSLQAWQLKEMQENQLFALYELKDNYLILYYRELDAKELKTLSFDLKTEVAGVYAAPANVAYLYYAEEYKYWSEGAAVRVGK